MREDRSARCLIISGGILEEGTFISPPGERDLVIAVDGGLRHCRSLGLVPGLLLGDFDSLDGELAGFVEELEAKEPDRVRRLSVIKDDTDTLAAIKEAMERGYRKIRIYGGGGGRLDHTVANLQSLLYAKKRGADARLLTRDGQAMIVSGGEQITFEECAEGYLSLFALGEKAEGLTIRGMKYPLEKGELGYDFPLGVSNEFIGQRAEISLAKGEVLVICQQYDKKV